MESMDDRVLFEFSSEEGREDIIVNMPSAQNGCSTPYSAWQVVEVIGKPEFSCSFLIAGCVSTFGGGWHHDKYGYGCAAALKYFIDLTEKFNVSLVSPCLVPLKFEEKNNETSD